MKYLSVFLLLSILPNIALCVGNSDGRSVVGWFGEKPSYVDAGTKNAWNEYPFYNVVRVEYIPKKGFDGYSSGTGSFISPRHILTNSHVAEGCGLVKGTPNCMIMMSDDDNRFAKVVAYGGNSPTEYSDENDWSILELVEKDICVKHNFGYRYPIHLNEYSWRAGFGALRVLSDQDIKNIKDAYAKAFYEKTKDDISDLTLNDVKNFVNDKGAIIEKNSELYDIFLKNYKAITKKDFIEDCLMDSYTLKVIDKCQIGEYTDNDSRVTTSCYGWHGDSGSAIVDPTQHIIAVINTGYHVIGGSNVFTHQAVLASKVFSDAKVKNLISEAKSVCENKDTTSKKGEMSKEFGVFARVGYPCLYEDLPEHATVGKYVEAGSKKILCDGVYCSCAALDCENGYYLVVNAKTGKSQGWCFRERKCPEGQHMNIIDGYKTDKRCVDDELEINEEDEEEEDNVDDTEVSTTNDPPVNSGEGVDMITPIELTVSDDSANAGSISNTTANNDESPVSTPIPEQRPNIGDECEKSDLPAYATDGHYIKSGSQKLTCANGVTCSCAATRCKPNYYLMVNDKGLSQGWCRSASCPNGKHLHIIDGYKTDGCK